MKRQDIAWYISFAYIVYLFIGQIPELKSSFIFNTFLTSLLLIVVYGISSVLIIGSKKSLLFFISAALIGSVFELLSIHTGIPFGKYVYTYELGPRIEGIPVFIPFLWASLGFFSYRAGGKILMPFLMVALDLSVDPRYSGHLWIWISKTQYYGDPWTNFLGWFITSAVIIMVYHLMVKNSWHWDSRALIFYTLFGIDNCISDLYDGLRVPAMISLIIFIAIFLLFIMKYTLEKNKPRESATFNFHT
ncbi:carotenoid biosynthesis protein [Caldiplasma sukawensis]